jgi:hypothetical protein
MPTIDNIAVLNAAYLWEQDRIDGWLDEMTNTLTEENENNPMIMRFLDTWTRYFKKIKESNENVIGLCQTAIDVNNDPGKSPADKDRASAETVRQINRVTHRKASLLPIVDAAQIRKTQSKYFEALDETLELEEEALDYIAGHLAG